MNNTNAHTEFTQADIKRYLAGTMSSKERYTIEKAALQDPFLSDAIEGYALVDSNDAEQRLAAIKNQLQQSKVEAKVITLNSTKNKQWLRIAAVVMLIAGAGMLAVYLMNSTSITNQEMVKTPQKQNNTPPLVTAPIDSAYPLAFVENKEKKLAEKKTINNDIQPIQQNKEINALADEQKEKANTSNKIEQSLPNASITQQLPEIKQAASDRILSGKITDETGNPVAAASIQVNKNAYISDKNGKFQITTSQNDSLPVTVLAVGFEPLKANLQPSQQNNIILKQSNQSLAEVVVTGYGNKSKKAFKSAASQPVQELIPNGGWENYEAYLKETIAAAKDSTQFNATEGTELEIIISPDGKPVKVNILNSKNRELNKKITAAIENGPGWVNTSRKKAKKKLVIKVQ